MKRVVLWQRVDTFGMEYAEIEFDPVRIEGEVILIEGDAPFAVSYQVKCDDMGMTSRALVRLKHAGTRSDRILARTSAGTWTLDGARMPELDGIPDIDLSVTPSTNTPPIRRLGLSVGQRAEVTALWVRFPTFEIDQLRQSYRRVSASRYEYESPALNFRTELECDNDGIVRTYGDLWACIPQ
jgi:hypothetical protein